MKRIMFIIFSFFLISCGKSTTLYLPIINHIDSDFYLSIVMDDIYLLKNYKIRKLSIDNKNIQIRTRAKINNENFIFQIKDNDKNIIMENNLKFPSGGIISNSAKGGLFVAMDIIITEDEGIKILYSEDVFKYGLP